MRVKIAISVLFFFWAGIINIFSQTYNQPNVSLRSHETLEISKVEITAQGTVIYLTVENRIAEGNFCADKNIYLIYPDGSRLKLTKANNIPVCPETYNFKSIGEKLQFTLDFPPLKTGTKWIDIVEDCTSNCFWFYGVTLDNDLNKKLDEAFSQASKGKPAENIVLFKTLLDSIDSQNLGIEGLLYINIINAAVEDADNVNTIVWYKRLASSHAPRLSYYIKYLNDKGIKY
ncbi:MAG: hypothetical protein NTV31_07035 [Bacteroidia bacterium]|nr:hypothetical protein [Bacteroidia bacterium]